MTWNAPKDKDPWQTDKHKKTDKPSSNQPPDLEAVFRQFFSKFNRAWGGKPTNTHRGHKSSGSIKGFSHIFIIALGVITLFYMLMGIYIVAPAERAVITQFGRYVKTVGPGPHKREP